MSFTRSSPLSHRLVNWIGACFLLLFATCVSAQDHTCEANFTHGGDAASGLTFATSRTIAGLSPREALAQYKPIAQSQGFAIGQESYGKQGGDLIVSQRASINARGFDLHLQADTAGNVSISATLPVGMSATPEAFRNSMCQALDRLRVGATPAAIANTTTQIPSFVPTPQESTDICTANFLPSGTSVEGQTFSTWSLGSAMDISSAIENLKAFTSQVKAMHLSTSAVHGKKATLTVALDNAAIVFDGGYSINGPDLRGFTIRLDLDAALDAVSFSVRMNKEQQSINQDRMRRLACTLVAIVANGAPPPEEKKPSRFRNPFKNPQKDAQTQLDKEIELMRKARTSLYQRAVHAGKAILFLPMTNVDHKYAQATANDLIPGGAIHQSYHFDQTTVLIWRATGDTDDIIRVGDQISLIREGLFGYVQSASANKTRYGIYIADPGSYDLVGLTYDLAHTSLPALSSKHWTTTPRLGMGILAITRDVEFSSHQQWFNAQYQNVQVYDGSTCDMVQTGGGVSGCAHWQENYHDETHVSDPGGWRTMVDKGYAGGLATSIKFAKPFAHFDVKPGAIIVSDGFAATPDSIQFDSNACHQAGDSLVDCNIDSVKLFRIPGSTSELQISPETAAKIPEVANFISKATYQPMTVNATKLEETPGSYEASWATPYSLTVH
ncbi:hypothetical protein IHE49_13985 [Rhodanobacter sp. 7MK24]|uniref:hypothetical protein n=1 Tax=Rhodanobacter sp. 7MK24 TaxID=2775922 RepID=UPI0017839A0F|nr:hypothetical protein [Rhodanobacter sp. 7MK24]MBD8881592.1 hypothetical protein [Rhodanobacter sp. 7MK24]